MDFFNAYDAMWKKYSVFSGRTSRREYWFAMLMHYAIMFLLGMTIAITMDLSPENVLWWLPRILGGLYLIATLTPVLAISVRRLHDTGKSGWWLLLNLVYMGNIICIVLLCLKKQNGDNKYGKEDYTMTGNQFEITYKSVCKLLNDKNIKFDIAIENEAIRFDFNFDGIGSQAIIHIDRTRWIMRTIGILDFEVTQDRLDEMLKAICLVNSSLINGAFKYAANNKHLSFEMGQYLIDSPVDEKVIEMVIMVFLTTLNNFSGSFYAINNGYLTAEQILEKKESVDE